MPSGLSEFAEVAIPVAVHGSFGTKMPTFADAEGKTAFKDILGGDATAQFEAIWQYLRAGRNIIAPE